MTGANLIKRKNLDVGRPRIMQGRKSRGFKIVLLAALLHLPLGVLVYGAGTLALLHPIIVFVIGMRLAIRKQERLDRVAVLIAYLIGAEVLWRMAHVPIYWEFGKIGSLIIMGTALVQRRRFQIPKLPFLFFLCLLPACVLTFVEFGVIETRSILSANISGPVLLAVSCWFFSNVRVTRARINQLLLALIIPLLSVAFATLFFTVTAEQIQFNTESNLTTSGGFGPNQVSSMLGLGLFASVVCLILFKNDTKFKIFFGITTIFFAAQSALTFSRGGIYNAVGGILIMVLFQLRNPAEGIKRFIPFAAPAFIFVFFVLPYLNDFTGGKLQERYEEASTSNRTEIVHSDLEIFSQNPIFGVGVGVSDQYRERITGFVASSHTEFARLMSEHGSLGILAIVSMFLMAITTVKGQKSTFGRALVAGFCVWCVLYMLNTGTRLAAPSFVWGISYISLITYRIGVKPNPFHSKNGTLRGRTV